MWLSRRDFLKGLGLFASSLTLGCGFDIFKDSAINRAFKELGEFGRLDGEISYLRQIITKNNQTSRTIMWQTKDGLWSNDGEKKDHPAVIYRLVGGGPWQEQPALREKFADDGRTSDIYTACLTNLLSGRVYEYAISWGKKRSHWHPLTTDSGEGNVYQCLIFPDSQSSDYTDWKNLAQAAAKRHKDAAWFINLGDLVDNGEQKSQWDAWFNALDGIIDRLAIAPVMGNHETYDLNWQVRWPKAYLANFSLPTEKSTDFDRFYYSFDYGDAHFVVLNTQMREINSLHGNEAAAKLLKEQLAWLESDLKKTKRKWKIALLHRDVLRYRIKGRTDRQEGIEDIGRYFMPYFEKYDFDLVFTAHLHTYRNRGHIVNFRRERGGPFYILAGVAGNVRYPGLWLDHALDQTVAPQPETNNYLVLTVSRTSLLVECFLPDGTRIDRVLIGK